MALTRQLLQLLNTFLRERLPSNWSLEVSPGIRRTGGQPDGQISLIAPDGASAHLVIEVKRRLDPKDVLQLSSQLRRYAMPGEQLFAAAPFLGPRTREMLIEEGINYLDSTGNLRLVLDQPAVYIEQSGASRNPKADQRQLRSLKGPAAGRAVRALCDFRPPFGVRILASRTGTSAASISRVATFLERETLLARNAIGEIVDMNWQGIIKRWAQDYGLTKSNSASLFLEPRGMDALLSKLTQTPWQYAVTGTLAAARLAPVAPPRLAVIYVTDQAMAATDLNLRAAERGANVLLVQPFDTVVFERTIESGSIVYAAPTQVAADLLTSPGRGPQEAQALLQWMEEHEDAWRARI